MTLQVKVKVLYYTPDGVGRRIMVSARQVMQTIYDTI